MNTFVDVRHSDLLNTDYALFRLVTSAGREVFMRIDRKTDGGDKVAVVEVDAEKFLEMWRASEDQYSDVAMGSPKTWVRDGKFERAEAGFESSVCNPVPIIHVYCDRARLGGYGLSMNNGVTRTIWLLACGVPVFPVSVSLESAVLLQKYAGADGSQFQTVEQLMHTLNAA